MLDCFAGSTALKHKLIANEKLQSFDNTTGMLLMVCYLNNYLWLLKLHNYYIT